MQLLCSLGSVPSVSEAFGATWTPGSMVTRIHGRMVTWIHGPPKGGLTLRKSLSPTPQPNLALECQKTGGLTFTRQLRVAI